jgi:hypothetical protein
MSARLGVSPSSNARHVARAAQRRKSMPSMSSREASAYLLARDALRRIRRMSGCDPEGVADGAEEAGRMER